MQQKTYEFPRLIKPGEDPQSEKFKFTCTMTLAPPTLRRTAEFLDLFGVKSFDELRTPDGQLNYAMFVLESGRDPEKLKKALDVCLIEGSVEIDFDSLDLRVSDEVIQDFFEQRSKTLLSRMSVS